MIFVVETENRFLYAFSSASEAIDNCEALDVKAAIWLFWNDAGEPLEPYFLKPNKRGLFACTNGVYELRPADRNHHAVLDEALNEIIRFETSSPYDTAAGVREHMAAHRAA